MPFRWRRQLPFNGSGVYVPPSLPGSFNPAISGQQATPADWNTLLTDLATALSTAITKDGQTTVTANIPFGGFRVTNVGNATVLTDATTAGQVQNARHTYAIDTGSVNHFTIAPLPACAAYQIGQSFQFKAIHSNNTSTPDLAVSGLTAGIISWANGDALPVSAIVSGGTYEVIVATVTTGTPTFHLQTPLSQVVRGITVQKFTSGTAATYTTPAGVVYLKIRVIGGGGGGGGVGATTGPTGGTGGTTTFNAITAIGGIGGMGGTPVSNGSGGIGGSGGAGSPTLRVTGSGGAAGLSGAATSEASGTGGSGPFGGGGAGVETDSASAPGIAGATNSGAGGSGAVGASATCGAAGGGGSGEYYELIINGPAATYTYTVGAAGAGGIGTGTAAQTGGVGGAGLIMVEEYYS